jgi:hypothetical protein
MSDEGDRDVLSWFNLTLRTLLMLVVGASAWYTRQINYVHERNAERAWIERRGGIVYAFPRPAVPTLWSWLGDEAINKVMLPPTSSEAGLARTKAIFPESEIEIMPAKRERDGQ